MELGCGRQGALELVGKVGGFCNAGGRWIMVAVASGAGIGDAAGGTVAGGASGLCGHEHIGGEHAGGGGVASYAGDLGVTGVVEAGVGHPDIGNAGGGDARSGAGWGGLDDVAKAAGIATGGSGRVAKEYLALKGLAGRVEEMKRVQFLRDMGAERGARETEALNGVIGIGGGQGAEKGAGGLGAAMGDDERRGCRIDGQVVARLAVEGETDGLHEGAALVGNVAGSAVETLTIEQRNGFAGEVEGVVEGERIGIDGPGGVEAELRVVGGKRGDAGGETLGRAGDGEGDATVGDFLGEQGGVEAARERGRVGHLGVVAMAGRAVGGIDGEEVLAAALMFEVARRARGVVGNAGLVERVRLVAGLAGGVHRIEVAGLAGDQLGGGKRSARNEAGGGGGEPLSG